MKKNNAPIVLIISILLLSFSGFSQPLTLSWEGETIGDTLIVTGLTTDFEIVAHAIVSNNSNHSMDIKVRRDQIQVIEGTLNQFCWGSSCYPPNVNESPGFLTLGPGQSTLEGQFSGHYLPLGNFGDSFIEYEFFNMTNEDENVKVIVHFIATTVGISEDDTYLTIYPNPASESITINMSHSIDAVLVYDCTGRKVLEEQVNSNSYLMKTSFLSSGLYLFRITTHDKVITKSIVIK